MWLTEGCGGKRRTVATPNRESRKEKKKNDMFFLYFKVSKKHLRQTKNHLTILDTAHTKSKKCKNQDSVKKQGRGRTTIIFNLVSIAPKECD